jgi:hypothetical protein
VVVAVDYLKTCSCSWITLKWMYSTTSRQDRLFSASSVDYLLCVRASVHPQPGGWGGVICSSFLSPHSPPQPLSPSPHPATKRDQDAGGGGEYSWPAGRALYAAEPEPPPYFGQRLITVRGLLDAVTRSLLLTHTALLTPFSIHGTTWNTNCDNGYSLYQSANGF